MTKYFIELTEQDWRAEVSAIQKELTSLDSASVLLSADEVTQLENVFKTQTQKDKLLNISFRYIELREDTHVKLQKSFPAELTLFSIRTNPALIPWTYIELKFTYIELKFNFYISKHLNVSFFLNREDEYWFVELIEHQLVDELGGSAIELETTRFRCDGFYGLLKLLEYKIFPIVAEIREEIKPFEKTIFSLKNIIDTKNSPCQVYKNENGRLGVRVVRAMKSRFSVVNRLNNDKLRIIDKFLQELGFEFISADDECVIYQK